MGERNILLWGALESVAPSLAEALTDAGTIARRGSADDAREILRENRPRLLVIDPVEIDPANGDVLRIALQMYPDLPVALLAPTSTSECFAFLRTYGIGAALPPSAEIQPAHLRVFLEHVASPEPPSALSALFAPGHPVRSEPLEGPMMRDRLLDMIERDLADSAHVDLNDLQLVFEEILNNAIFHAFRTEKNDLKYTLSSEGPFEPNDEIIVEWSANSEVCAMAVSDNQGLLSPRIIWDRFLRQTSLQGLYDTDGRGLYLSHLLSRLVLVTIDPGRKTQVAVFFSPGMPARDKPISVRVCRGRGDEGDGSPAGRL